MCSQNRIQVATGDEEADDTLGLRRRGGRDEVGGQLNPLNRDPLLSSLTVQRHVQGSTTGHGPLPTTGLKNPWPRLFRSDSPSSIGQQARLLLQHGAPSPSSLALGWPFCRTCALANARPCGRSATATGTARGPAHPGPGPPPHTRTSRHASSPTSA